jgi:hypothetical protein
MRKIFLTQLILFSVAMFGQAPKRFFTKFGNYGVDIGYSGKPTLDRHYIVAGSTSSYGAGNTDVYLVKVDSMGFPIWEKTFGGFNNDVGRSVIQLSDSGYVVAGFTNSYGAGGYDAYILKTDKNGNLIWQKTFGGLDWDFAYDVVLAADGDIVVCGNTSSSGAGKKDGLLLKYDLAGNLIWQKTIGGTENEELRSVIKTNDNFLATVGYTESNGDVNGDIYFYKFDLNGNTIFYNITGGPGKDYANDIVQKLNTDYVICGAKTYSSNPNTESFMYCMSSIGAPIWENHNYNSNSTDEAFVSVSNSYQNPGFAAFLRSVPVPAFKMEGNIYIGLFYGYAYKVNSFCGFEDEILQSVEPTTDGGFLCVGSTLSFGSIGEDVFLIKFDSTIFTYSSVVGLKNTSHEQKPELLYEDQHNIKVVFGAAKIPDEVEICDLNGKIVRSFFPKNESLRIDMADIAPSFYVLRIKYLDGSYYNIKIVRS